ncbi:MAG: acetyl-CoA carboxylase, carboxyltransferase subunit beta [Candidatus Eremiobacteraeota bacterium]|nr:acetyl-CoA carboxylase, carboxyltransferase subunit beta [Candidatus Eremiobacteraeota bacterium]
MPEWLRLRRATPIAADQAAQWTKCPKCSAMIYRPDLAANMWVCTTCKHHFRMHAFDRISLLVDADFTEIGGELMPGDPLGWADKVPYTQKLQRDREKSKLTEGVMCGFASIGGYPVALGVMDFNFRGGTMGTVVGERIALLFERARERKVPCVVFTASGGARMEEGMLALMQMAKTTLAVRRFRDDGGYYMSVLTDPTTGGVSASFAFQADVILAEARAAIGFAGRRVIEQTIRQKLPENFQTAEFLLEKGAIDMVVERSELKNRLVRLLDYGVGARRPLNGQPAGAVAPMTTPQASTERRP